MCAIVAAMAVGAALSIDAQSPQSNPLPGTKLSIDKLKKQMFHVSAGKRLKPRSWPGGARVAVSLSFDVDNATANLSIGTLEPLTLY